MLLMKFVDYNSGVDRFISGKERTPVQTYQLVGLTMVIATILDRIV
ncbi:MAG: hypothetical protein PWR10_1 [Halanaerobiales bacterium]|nr:hypothetical protein [Halanaerobiales bacterium]